MLVNLHGDSGQCRIMFADKDFRCTQVSSLSERETARSISVPQGLNFHSITNSWLQTTWNWQGRVKNTLAPLQTSMDDNAWAKTYSGKWYCREGSGPIFVIEFHIGFEFSMTKWKVSIRARQLGITALAQLSTQRDRKVISTLCRLATVHQSWGQAHFFHSFIQTPSCRPDKPENVKQRVYSPDETEIALRIAAVSSSAA